MQSPASDHPRLDRAAIASFVAAEQLRPGGAFGRTTTLSGAPVRYQRAAQRTNAVRRQLSIESARLASLSAAAREELDRYARLTSGWDGYDADPIAPIAIETARLLVDGLSVLPMAMQLTDIIPGPAPDGSLDLELRTSSRRLRITIYKGESPNELEVHTLRTSGEVREEKSDLEAAALVEDLRWILA